MLCLGAQLVYPAHRDYPAFLNDAHSMTHDLDNT